MNYFFENVWIIEIILLILIITVSTIYFKSKESSKWQKLAQILDKIWIKLCLIALGAFWIEIIFASYMLIREFK